MITLYNFGEWRGLADPSPFCMKVDCYMRAAGIEFEVKSGAQYLSKAPKKKIPFIEDEGQLIGDSAFIIDYLKKKYGDPLDAELTSEQMSVTHAFSKMLDENLYWCLVKSRWIGDQYPQTREDFFGDMPPPLKWIVPVLAQRGVKKTLYLHGIGRHSDEEMLEIARKDFQALSDYIGDKDFFHGKGPSTMDVIAFAFLVEFIKPDVKLPLNEMARSYPNLVAFVERLHQRYYVDS